MKASEVLTLCSHPISILKVKALVTQSCPTLCIPVDCSPPDSSVWNSPGKNTGVSCHPFSKRSSRPRNWTRISVFPALAGGVPNQLSHSLFSLHHGPIVTSVNSLESRFLKLFTDALFSFLGSFLFPDAVSSHLFLGTLSSFINSHRTKGRQGRGSAHPVWYCF